MLSQNFCIQKKKSVHDFIYLQIQIENPYFDCSEDFYIPKDILFYS